MGAMWMLPNKGSQAWLGLTDRFQTAPTLGTYISNWVQVPDTLSGVRQYP